MEMTGSDRKLSFYSERNSVGIENDVEKLFQDPDVQLTPEQRQAVHEFAQAVYDGRVYDLRRESAKNLEELQSMSVAAFIQEFYTGYFLTPQGKEDKVKMGIQAESEDEVITALGDIETVIANVDAKARKRIAKNSFNWYKKQIVEALEVDRELDDAQLDHSSVHINYNPDKLIEKLANLAAHRRFYREVKRRLKTEPDSPVKDAKILELELGLARANNMMAGLYNDVLELGQQLLKRPQSIRAKVWLKQIEALTPVVYRALTRDRNEVEESIDSMVAMSRSKRQSLDGFGYHLSRRTDHLMQGVAWTEDGQLSPISEETLEFAAQVVHENEKQEVETKPVFDEATVEKMKKIKWSAQQFKEFCEAIAKEWGILSAYEADWSQAVEREAPAEDDQWQIIIDPQTDSIKVSRTKKLLHIPETFNRDLTKSLTVAAHELAHLAQAESDSALAEQIPLAASGGRRISAMREGGAVDQEAKAYAYLGVKRPTRVGYLAALQAKLSGANLVQVARAFYDAYEDDSRLSEEEKHDNKKLAADRALRLYRNGGYNSQPLDYIEGELTKRVLAQASPGLVEAIMLAGASFSLRDAMRLHRAGLYDAPTSTKYHPADDVMRVFKERYLPELVAD